MTIMNSIAVVDETQMKNRLTKLFMSTKRDLLAIYYTAGYPNLDSTIEIARYLELAGADIIEVGMPFSDPIADGPVIQNSSTIALRNGMTIAKVIEQTKIIRNTVTVPILLMGYFNPVLQYGVERFCREAVAAGVDGIILPDLPMREYQLEYAKVFASCGMHNIFLISPTTSDDRIRAVDAGSSGFIYAVSSAATTGASTDFSPTLDAYLSRLRSLALKNPWLVGFGISDHASFRKVCDYASGAIVGSAFVAMLETSADIEKDTREFIKKIKSP